MNVTRVVIVDDDDISRKGFAELLREHPELEVVGALDHEGALSWSGSQWSLADVALVDAADERGCGDQFPGVGVVEAIRAARSPAETTVVVVTGHFFDDALRARMREAGADFFYHRSQFADADRLYRVLLHPDGERAFVPPAEDPEALFRVGVTPSTRINDAVRLAKHLPPPDATGGPVARRSRAWLRYRQVFNEIARLNPVNADGTIPERDQRYPSLPQIERFLQWATRSKQR